MGTPHKVMGEWHTEILPRATKRALDLLSTRAWLKRSKWYLAGGTALGLHVGHRRSLDLDFFTPQNTFSTAHLLEHFYDETWTTHSIMEGTIYGALCGAKVSFIAYPFFRSSERPLWYGSIRILTPHDIAVMKIIAISQRGKKRDFIDLYWYTRNREPLLDLIRCLPKQYPTVAHDYHHIVKSLTYFKDAESEPMPTLFFDADWKRVKKYFQSAVTEAAHKLILS